jgi:hypothetical protein
MPKFSIVWGVPHAAALWEDLCAKADAGTLDGTEKRLFKKLFKFAELLSNNPRHPGLSTHPISDLSARINRKVWQSYLENNPPGAGRAFWVYGPDEMTITVLAIEPHPESGKNRGYASVRLSEIRQKRKD